MSNLSENETKMSSKHPALASPGALAGRAGAAGLFLGALWLVVNALAGCGAPPRACVPGETQACVCAGGGRGAQVCGDDGARFGVCDCGGAADGGSGGAGDAGDAGDAGEAADAGAAARDAGATPVDCASLGVPLPAGWRRGMPTLFTEVPWIEIAGVFWNPFPNGGGTGRILTGAGEYLALEFTTPADVADWLSRAPNRLVYWDRSQVGGEADVVYVGLSSCPGDFRIPPAGQAAPPGDPTFARGCRSFRRGPTGLDGPASSIGYEIGEASSDETTCRLAPGRRYYLNFIRADVRDGAIGAPEAEAACVNPELTTCGVQMRVD